MRLSAWMPHLALLAWPKTEALKSPLASQQLRMLHSLLPSACVLLLLLLHSSAPELAVAPTAYRIKSKLFILMPKALQDLALPYLRRLAYSSPQWGPHTPGGRNCSLALHTPFLSPCLCRHALSKTPL